MERDTNQMSQSSASLCRSGCGFYGNPSSDGLCSKCYKDAVKRKQSAPTSAVSSQTSTTDRSSPISAPIVDAFDSSNNSLPQLIATNSSTIDSNLNTASPTVPSAVITSAQDCATNLESSTTVEHNQSNAEKESPQQTPLENQTDPPKTQKKKKTKCTKCKVNVGVIGFPCRCGGIFCSAHRYANEHSCTFDYREHGAEEIRKNNPQVIGEKIKRI